MKDIDISQLLQKVLASGKNFLIVTDTEPYYMQVYDMIRDNEMMNGTWTDECEKLYKRAWKHINKKEG